MRPGWLLRGRVGLPGHLEWLSGAERATLAGHRFERRRSDWLLGRYTAKIALAAHLGVKEPFEWCALEIHSDEQGAPHAFLHGRTLDRGLSLSHRGGAALCVVAPPATPLGCDLERVEPRPASFLEDYFGPEECAEIEGAAPEQRTRLETAAWSAKESALKALGIGLRRDTRELRVRLGQATGDARWCPLRVELCEGGELAGWWRSLGAWVVTIVSQPGDSPPAPLAPAARDLRVAGFYSLGRPGSGAA